jgi:hypothetical protein
LQDFEHPLDSATASYTSAFQIGLTDAALLPFQKWNLKNVKSNGASNGKVNDRI